MKAEIRLAIREDVPSILEIYGPIIEETATSFESTVPNADIFWTRIQTVLKEAPWLVCTFDGVVVGYAYAGAHRARAAYQWNRELSVYVHQDFRGRAIATALYTSLISLIKKQGFTNMLIGITLPNEVSVRFHEKLGFKGVGTYRDVGFKFGRYHDVGWWQMKLTNDPPDEIRSPHHLTDTEWEEAITAGLQFFH